MTISSIPSLAARVAAWIFQVVAAVILLQTLFFKFTGAPESVYIFETVGLEPVGRYASGLAEGVAGVLLLVPSLAWLGALLAAAVMSGAIFFHLTSLGIVVRDDGGMLFAMALVVLFFSLGVIWIRRQSILRRFPLQANNAVGSVPEQAPPGEAGHPSGRQ